MKISGKDYRTVWMEGQIVKMIDQPKLPHRFEIVELKSPEEVAEAIRTMVVRGAPAIGASGAYGLAQAALISDEDGLMGLKQQLRQVSRLLAQTRPTARDLFDGLECVERAILSADTVEGLKKKAVDAALKYAQDSVDACMMIGEFGDSLIRDGMSILTHCNAGALATVDFGTALAPIRIAHRRKKRVFVYVDETRPRCQGSRLTAFELSMEGIPHAIIADNAAGHYMQKKKIDLVIVGADRIAINGDVANKIGTFEKAVIAKHLNVPFYVAAPLSTIDLATKTGREIPIEERDPDEVLCMFGIDDQKNVKCFRISPDKSLAYNPAFDVTPAELVTGIITEKGIIKPDETSLLKVKNS